MVTDILLFENLETLAIAIGFLLFVISFFILAKMLRSRGPALIIALVIASITSWQLYVRRFYGWERILAVGLIIAVLAVLVKIFWAFIRGARRQF